VNSGFYCEVLRRLRVNVRRRRPQLWRQQSWLLYHDNTPSHTSVLTQQFLAKYEMAGISPWFDIPWLLSIFENETETGRTPVWYHWGDPGRIAECAWHSDIKGFPESVPKIEKTVGPVSTCGSEILRGWWRPIGLIVIFMIFTASVLNILDTPSYSFQKGIHLEHTSLKEVSVQGLRSYGTWYWVFGWVLPYVSKAITSFQLRKTLIQTQSSTSKKTRIVRNSAVRTSEL
jgi:hypothetical protein